MNSSTWLFFASILFVYPTFAQSIEGQPSRYERRQLRLASELGVANYKVDAEGGAIDSTDYNNFAYGFEAYFPSAHFSSRLGYRHSATRFNGPADSTPSELNSLDKTMYAMVGTKLFAAAKDSVLANVTFNGGYYFKNRTADRATPTELMVDSDRNGFILGAEYLGTLNQDFNQHFQTNFYSINSFTEGPQRTGFFKSGYELEIKYAILYPISRYVEISGGVHVSYGEVGFRGEGDRGLSGAKESDFRYGIPFEIWITF